MNEVTDNLFSDFLLKKIRINHNNKTLREGKLLLFSIKDFYLHFTLDVDGAIKHFELPYPFEVIKINDSFFLLDFTLSAFRAEFDDIERKIKNIGEKKKSRYYNSIIQLVAS
jgi:hypothetical protein